MKYTDEEEYNRFLEDDLLLGLVPTEQYQTFLIQAKECKTYNDKVNLALTFNGKYNKVTNT